jgi:predicted phosphodiesterase
MTETIFGTPIDFDYENVVEIDLPIVRRGGREYGEICFIGDIHYGHQEFSERHLHQYLQMLQKKKHIQICLMGDLFEMQSLCQFLKEATCPEAEQLRMFVEDFKPLASRIRTMVFGNHESRFMRASEGIINLWDYLRLKLENKDIYIAEPGRGILCAVKAGSKTYSMYMLHSASRAQVHPDTQLRKSRNIWAVDIIAHGHTHRKLWHENVFYTLAKTSTGLARCMTRQFLLSTGTFLGYPSYAEERSYPLNVVGAPIVRFYADAPSIEYVDPQIQGWLSKGGLPYEHAQVDLKDFPASKLQGFPEVPVESLERLLHKTKG